VPTAMVAGVDSTTAADSTAAREKLGDQIGIGDAKRARKVRSFDTARAPGVYRPTTLGSVRVAVITTP